MLLHVPLLVEVEAEACDDEGEERHEDGHSNRAAVGGAVGFRVAERDVLSHAQTWRGRRSVQILAIMTWQ